MSGVAVRFSSPQAVVNAGTHWIFMRWIDVKEIREAHGVRPSETAIECGLGRPADGGG